MKMAKATEEDVAAALLLCGILDDVDDGEYPREIEGDGDVEAPEYFDENNIEHFKTFYRRVMHCVKVRPSGISRVIWGFRTIMDNNILDPNVDHLELHPRLNSEDLLKAAKEALAVAREIEELGYDVLSRYAKGNEFGDRVLASTQALAKAINDKEPKQEERPAEAEA
jgi:hypothetical protein